MTDPPAASDIRPASTGRGARFSWGVIDGSPARLRSKFLADFGRLAIALACVQSAVLVGGRTLIPLAPSYSTMPHFPYQYSGPRSVRASTIDPAGSLNIAFAFDAYAIAAARDGDPPFWNPYQGLGQPFLANPLSALFYPLRAINFVLSPRWWDLAWILNLLLGAGFLTAFLRLIGLPGPAALVGGLAVLGSGYFQQYLALREVVASAVWCPLLLYAMERARLEPAWPHRHWVLCLGVFCTIAGGQPEVAFVSLLAVLLYAVARWLRELSTAVRLYAPGAVAGLLLASPLTLPFVDYGWSASSGHGAGTQVGIMNASVWTAMGYLVPYLFGPIHAASLDTSMWFLAPGWMPAAVLFLALASCIGGRDRRPRGLTVLAAMTLLVAAKMWGAPGTDWLGGLPLFERIIYPRYASFLLTFGLAGMAAFGLVCLAGWTAREWRIAAGLWLAILVAVLAGATLAGRAPMPASHFALLGGAWAIVVPAGLWWVHTTYRGDLTRPGLAVAAATLLQAEAYLPGYSSYTYIGLGLGCLVLFAVIVAVIVATALTERGAGAVLVCAVVAAPPLGVALVLPDGLARRYDPLIRPPYLDTLERLQEGGRYRAYPIDSTPQPNFSAPFKLSTLSNLEVLLPQGSARFVHRYLDRGSGAAWFAGNYSGGRQPRTTALDEFRTNRRFFDLVATRHLVTHGASYSKAPDLFALEPSTVGTRGASPTALSLVYEDHTSVRIWENRQAVPRVFLASEVEIASSPADALARLERFADLTRRVAIETGEPLAPSSSPGPPGTLLSFVLAPDTVRIEYRADVPGILTMTDSYEEGWRARLDGVEAPVLRVNGVFRGIRLERPGRYRLEMRYRPPRWTISLVLAAGGVLMLVAASLSIRRRKS